MNEVKKKLTLKQVVFYCLALMLVICYMPTTAFADESDDWNVKVGLTWVDGEKATTEINVKDPTDKSPSFFTDHYGPTNVELKISTNKKSYAPGEMEIRMPGRLDGLREGAVKGGPSSPASMLRFPALTGATPNCPFKCTYDSETNEIIITNYATLDSTSNFVIPGLYAADNSDMIDGTSGSVTAECKTTVNGVEEKISSNEIKYSIDTSATLTSWSMYGDMIESFGSLKSYLSDYGKFSDEKIATFQPTFDDYWYVRYITSGGVDDKGQPYQISESYKPENNGEVVCNHYPNGALNNFIVVRYPKTAKKETLTMNAEFKCVPIDGKDEPTTKTLSCKVNASQYGFSYSGDVYKVYKELKKAGNYNRLECYDLLSRGKDTGLRPHIVAEVNEYRQLEGYNIGTYRADLIDDFMEWRTTDGEFVEMTPDDYYHKSVHLSMESDIPNYTSPGSTSVLRADKFVTIYAMIKGSSTWTKVKEIPETDIGGGNSLYFDLPADTYRVKLSTDYMEDHLRLSADLETVIRADSPTLKKWKKEDPDLETKQLFVRNFDASMVYDKNGKLLNPVSEENHVSNDKDEKDRLMQRDLDTYGDLVQRSVGIVTFQNQKIEGRADAVKTMYITGDGNQESGGRKLLEIRLCVLESYGGSEADAIKSMGLTSPIKEAVFYDLLPLGVTYNQDQYPPEVTHDYGIGEIQTSVETKENYKGTGRQLVIIKAKGQVDFDSDMMRRFWLSFKAYVDVDAKDIFKDSTNIAAYQSDCEIIDNKGFVDTGEDFEAAKLVETEDGSNVFNDLAGDGNTDGKKDTLYMSAKGSDFATTSASGFAAKVCRGDVTSGNEFLSEVKADLGGKYTYKLSARNDAGSGTMKDVILFDKLEMGANTEGNTGETSWKGTLDHVNTKYIEAAGIKAEIYYSTNSNPKAFELKDISAGAVPSGWIKGDPSTLSDADKAKVTAVAVDISKNADGSDKVFTGTQGTTAYIVMKAPKTLPTSEYAYNYGTYYSKFISSAGVENVETNNTARVKVSIADPVKVTIKGTVSLTGVRTTVKDKEFQFNLKPQDTTNAPSTTANDSKGNLQFNELSFNEEGTYKYTVDQNDLGEEGIEYDKSQFEVTIVVTKDSNTGELSAKVSYIKGTEAVDEIAFVNKSYDNAPVPVPVIEPVTITNLPTVTKTITGDTPAKEKTFTFKLAPLSGKDADDNEIQRSDIPASNNDTATVKTAKVNEAVNASAFGKLTFKEAGTYVYEIREVKESEAGYTYDETAYLYTVTVTADQNGTLTANGKLTNASNEDVTKAAFTNTYKATKPAEAGKVPADNNGNEPKTGDETALGLWIMLLVVAAGACGCIVGIKKRGSKEK